MFSTLWMRLPNLVLSMLKGLFDKLKEKKHGAFMAHVYYGDPNEEFSIELIKTLVHSGVDILEFGIPFSDPTADGPTFIGACQRSLKNGMTPQRCIVGIRKIRELGYTLPIVVTAYYNVIYQYGTENFICDIKKAGAQALIVPELVIEESEELAGFGKKHGVDIIYMIGENSSDRRIEKIVRKASGFLYLAAVSGVTGARENLENPIFSLIKRVRKHTDLPLMVGFGISKKEHAQILMKAGADGIIIGSAIGKIYEKYINGSKIDDMKCLKKIAGFASDVKKGLE